MSNLMSNRDGLISRITSCRDRDLKDCGFYLLHGLGGGSLVEDVRISQSFVKKIDETLDDKIGDGGARRTPGDLESRFLLCMGSTYSDLQVANGTSPSNPHRANIVLDYIVRH